MARPWCFFPVPAPHPPPRSPSAVPPLHRYELLTRRPPWDTLPDNYIEVWGFLDTQLPNGVRPPVDPALAQPHPEYIKIMNDAWLTDPAARPTFAEVETACLALR